MSTSQSASSSTDMDALERSLMERLQKSGQAEELLNAMSGKLKESGWVDEVKNFAKERARSQSTLSYDTLHSEVHPYAQQRVPEDVKKQIMAQIRAYVESQLDESGNMAGKK